MLMLFDFHRRVTAELKKPTHIPRPYGRKKFDEPARKPSSRSPPSSSYRRNSNLHEPPLSLPMNASNVKKNLARHVNRRHLLPVIN